MKLTNPTDGELNAAFAEHVAGWKRGDGVKTAKEAWYCQGYCVAPINTPEGIAKLNFINSFDAVLPWLEKWGAFNTWSCKLQSNGYTVHVLRCKNTDVNSRVFSGMGMGVTLPRAAVNALLRTHLVEVEFTDAPQ